MINEIKKGAQKKILAKKVVMSKLGTNPLNLRNLEPKKCSWAYNVGKSTKLYQIVILR